jgi:hypothetical protein
MQKHFSAAQNVLLALAVIALGAYVLMAGQAFKAPGWIAVLCGGAFIVCGLLLLSRGLAPDGKFSGPLPADTPFWLRASQYVAVVALFGIFNMSVPWFVPEQASESMGRIAFGASAAIAWFCTATIAVQGGRKLFAKADR